MDQKYNSHDSVMSRSKMGINMEIQQVQKAQKADLLWPRTSKCFNIYAGSRQLKFFINILCIQVCRRMQFLFQIQQSIIFRNMQNPYLNNAKDNNLSSPMTQNSPSPYANTGQTYQNQAYSNQNYPNQTYNNTYPNASYNYNTDTGATSYPANNTVYVANNRTQFDNIEIIKQPQNDPLSHLDNSLQGQARKKFIMKVYLILSIQLAITVAMCFISYYVRPFLLFQYENQWLMWVLFVLMIVVEIVIFCCPAGRRYPINMIALLIFTLCEAYLVSYICSLTAYSGNGAMVIVAAVMTLAIVVGLTIYAVFTKTDFTMMWGVIWILFMSFLVFGIFTGIGWSYWLYNLYCVFGVILFGIYILFDTQMIIGGKRLQLSMDDYVIGALILYIDIIQMFLYILALLGRR